MEKSENSEELETALDHALEAGYRHFDTAYDYGNEGILGNVLKKWLDAGRVNRAELFIVTKLPVQGVHHQRVEKFLTLELKLLQLDYVDLYLVHNPAAIQTSENGLDYAFDEQGQCILDLTSSLEQVWEAMEAQVTAGRAKSIGISNFSVQQVERIVKCAKILPANHQVEWNPNFPKKTLREAGTKHGITICAFSALGSPGRNIYYERLFPNSDAHTKVSVPNLLGDPVVVEIGKKHSKTPAQVLIRFLAQQDIVVIPKSVSPARIKENIDIFDFDLDTVDMEKLDSLKINEEGTWGFDWVLFLPGLEKHPEFHLTIS